jgi:type I restriction enzyme S subunit
MSFPRYPKYKASGVEWLGEVPEHWEVKRLKSACRFFGGGTPSRENPAYWNGAIPWVSPKDMKSEFIGSTEESISSAGVEASAATLLEVGHALLVVRSGILQHTIPVAINTVAVAVNQDIRALRFDKELCDPRFFLRWVQGLNDRLLLEWSKQGATVESIEHVLLANSPICLPPLAEQRAIALFLDRETKKIDELVAEQERLIELLKEKRQAVISHAVTKGLDPAAPMKPSGVEWLGDVPAHWEVKRLKQVAVIQSGIAKGKDYGTVRTVSVPYLRVANVQDGYVDLDEVASIEIPAADIERFAVRKGDVLMNEGGDWDKLGRGCVWEGQVAPCVHQNHVFVVRPGAALDPAWLSLFSGSAAGQYHFARHSKQSTNLASISSTNLMELPVPVPPLRQQADVGREIAKQCASVSALMREAESAITLLQERRSALISAAVTGQIDVRNAVPEVSA